MDKKTKKDCYFDEKRSIMIHVFEIHAWRCNCGKKTNRVAIKEESLMFLFGKGLDK
jgi:hypothetical protein